MLAFFVEKLWISWAQLGLQFWIQARGNFPEPTRWPCIFWSWLRAKPTSTQAVQSSSTNLFKLYQFCCVLFSVQCCSFLGTLLLLACWLFIDDVVNLLVLLSGCDIVRWLTNLGWCIAGWLWQCSVPCLPVSLTGGNMQHVSDRRARYTALWCSSVLMAGS